MALPTLDTQHLALPLPAILKDALDVNRRFRNQEIGSSKTKGP